MAETCRYQQASSEREGWSLVHKGKLRGSTTVCTGAFGLKTCRGGAQQ